MAHMPFILINVLECHRYPAKWKPFANAVHTIADLPADHWLIKSPTK